MKKQLPKEPRGAGVLRSGPLTPEGVAAMTAVIRQYKRDNPAILRDLRALAADGKAPVLP